MWILFLISSLVYCQTGAGGSNVQWKANMGDSSGGIPINTKSNSKFDWSSLGHMRSSGIVTKTDTEIPSANEVNSVKNKKPLKFSREFLKLLAGANELGPIQSRVRVWTSTTTTTSAPPKPPPISSSPNNRPLKNIASIRNFPPPPPPPPPIDTSSSSSGFKVGRQDRPSPSLGAILESRNVLSNGAASTKSNQDVRNALTNGNGSFKKEPKQKSITKTHNRKKFNKDIKPVPHIGDKPRDRPSLSGGMSLFDVVNSKPGFEEYIKLNQAAETTVHSTIDTTTTTTIKSITTTTTTKAPIVRTTVTTTTTAKPIPTTKAPKPKSDVVAMVHSSLSQPLQFADQLKEQQVEMGLRSSQDQPQNSGSANNMEAILAQLRSSSSQQDQQEPSVGQGFGGQNKNRNQMSNQQRNMNNNNNNNNNNNRNNRNRQGGGNGGAKGEMAAFLATLSSEQKRMFRDILGGNPAPTTPVPTTTPAPPMTPDLPPNIVKMMKAMGNNMPIQGPGPQTNQQQGPGPNNGPSMFNQLMNGQNEPNFGPGFDGPFNGFPQFGGPMNGIAPGGNRGNNNNNRGGPPGRNNAGGGGNNNFGGMGGGNSGGGGLEAMFGGPDMSQMMSMLSGGSGGGGGGMNPLSALLGEGGGLGALMGAMGGMGGGGGPMGGGRGNRGQRRMMPGGPNADPQTRRILMNRLLKRGMRPGADPADPPETPALGMMGGGAGGLAGLMGGPSAAWMGGGGGGGSGGGGGFPNMMNMGGGGGEGGGLGGLAGGLGAMMGGGGEVLAGGDPADAPPGRFGGMPMLKKRQAGPAPKPKNNVSTSTKSKSSPAQPKNTQEPKINSNVQSIFSYSLAQKTINNRLKEHIQSTPNESPVETPKANNTGNLLERKNSKALVEFIPLDFLPKHLLPQVESLLKDIPKHRRRPSPDTPVTDLSNEVRKQNISEKTNADQTNAKPGKTKIISSESIIETIKNISKISTATNDTVSLQKRFSNLPRNRPFDPNWQQPFNKYVKLAPRLAPDNSRNSLSQTNRPNPAWENNVNGNQGPIWDARPNNMGSSSSSWNSKTNSAQTRSGWNTPRNMVVNSPSATSPQWSRQRSWQNTRNGFNFNQNRWGQGPRSMQQPTSNQWQQQGFSQQAWGPPQLPGRRAPAQGPPLPNTRPPQTQQWQSAQSTNQWGNPPNTQPWPDSQNQFGQNQPPPQGNMVYNPQTATTPTIQPWDSSQNFNPPSTIRPWRSTSRPWQSQPPNPQGSHQSSNVNSFMRNQGQSSWVEIKPNQRQKTQRPPVNNFQQFNRKQPNVLDNSRPGSFMDPGNKGAFANVPTQQSLPKTTMVPPTAPWNSPPVTQAPPPPQWPVPGAPNAPMPTTGQQINPTEPWAPTNQQPQSWTSAPQFAAQPTTQPPTVTNSWNAGNNQFAGAGSGSFSRTNNNNNFGGPTTQAFNNQNFGGPTTAPYFLQQANNGGASNSFGTGSAGASSAAFGAGAGAASAFGGAAAGLLNPFADRIVTGPGIPPIQGDHISRLPPDIKLKAARMSLAGHSGDTIADVLGAEMRNRRRMGLIGNGMMGAAGKR
ncbi:hypothetical protein KUTeg_014543 [Tegillarca granosa]|uniref:Uncharacterized protein n=1 Tax=Tegillarca granosa TaxID=220873 RepID=A0ABQ9ERP3_TEGGR|nr:hypothetical protein KUTeg_014543 [Tegillarca granosa]